MHGRRHSDSWVRWRRRSRYAPATGPVARAQAPSAMSVARQRVDRDEDDGRGQGVAGQAAEHLEPVHDPAGVRIECLDVFAQSAIHVVELPAAHPRGIAQRQPRAALRTLGKEADRGRLRLAQQRPDDRLRQPVRQPPDHAQRHAEHVGASSRRARSPSGNHSISAVSSNPPGLSQARRRRTASCRDARPATGARQGAACPAR